MRKYKLQWRYDRRSDHCNLSNCKLIRKKFPDFKGIRTHCLCVSAAVLCQLSFEDPCIGTGQFAEFIFTRECNECVVRETREWNLDFTYYWWWRWEKERNKTIELRIRRGGVISKKICVYLRTRFSRTQMLLLEKNIDCIGIDSSPSHLTFVAFALSFAKQ